MSHLNEARRVRERSEDPNAGGARTWLHRQSGRRVPGMLAMAFVALAAATVAASAAEPEPVLAGTDRGALLWGVRFPLDRTAYEQHRGTDTLHLSNVALADGRAVDLEFTRTSVLAPDAQIVVGTPLGDVPLPRPPLTLYSGRIAGEPASRAFLSLSPFGVYGFVDHAGEMFIISSGPAMARAEPIVYSLTNLPPGLINWTPFNCGTELMMGDALPAACAGAASGQYRGDSLVGPCYVAEIALDTDVEFTRDLFGGDTTAATAYAITLLGAISEIYERDAAMRLLVSYLRLWEDEDPWTASDIFSQLTEFRSHWNNQMSHVSRHTAHLLMAQAFPEWTGVAYVGVLCNQHMAYALTTKITGFFPYPLEDHRAENQDIIVVAHEIGHNCGAGHTHGMSPPVDECGLGNCEDAWGGTIMSYCGSQCPPGWENVVLRFHERVVNEWIVPHIEQVVLAGCELPNWVTIQQHPQDAGVCPQAALALHVDASSPHPTLGFQWRRDGQDLTDDDRISGTSTATLAIDPVVLADEGDYDVIVTDDCASETSEPAAVTVVRITGDVNCDCEVDLFDLDPFVLALVDPAAYLAAYPECDLSHADCDGSGVVDLFDIDGFVDLLSP